MSAQETKNQAFSRRSGPPSEASKLGVWSSGRSSSSWFRARHFGFWPTYRKLPWSSFVPVLTVELITPPMTRPYSAPKPWVSSLDSARAVAGMMSRASPPRRVLLVSTPSISTWVSVEMPPFTAGRLSDSATLTTPGS